MQMTITSKRGSSLLFANLLLLIFAHFDIDLLDVKKEQIVGRFDEKVVKNLGISKENDAWTSKVVTYKPSPSTNEKSESLCQALEEMRAKLRLHSMQKSETLSTRCVHYSKSRIIWFWQNQVVQQLLHNFWRYDFFPHLVDFEIQDKMLNWL